MIVFFDVMLIDESSVLHQNYEQRRGRLEEVINAIPGRAELVTSKMFDFSSRSASHQLVEALATAFAHRWEGYVLKPINEPYVSLQSQFNGDYRSCWIKLKKDKIPGLGDTADFAVIGARYNAQEAFKLGVTDLPWTSFYIGCLQNKNDVLRLGSKPRFTILDGFDVGVTKGDLKELCNYGKFCAEKVHARRAPDAFDFSFEGRLPPKMAVVFTQPLVAEVKGTGFDKPPNTGFLTLRFPRIIKIHLGRPLSETVGFDELQTMAEEAINAPEGDFDDDVRKRYSPRSEAVDNSFVRGRTLQSEMACPMSTRTLSPPRKSRPGILEHPARPLWYAWTRPRCFLRNDVWQPAKRRSIPCHHIQPQLLKAQELRPHLLCLSQWQCVTIQQKAKQDRLQN